MIPIPPSTTHTSREKPSYATGVGENILDVFLAVPRVVGKNILSVFLAVSRVVGKNILDVFFSYFTSISNANLRLYDRP